ncbi:MAG: tyrosine--tRNA ligase [Rickettsiaceae bacterium]|nr:tyrosine--tRNA ligase [Rickettsiaceae bacterium]
MNFIEEFERRGYLYQSTDLEELKKLTKNESVCFYVGFDCTAESLHVGSLMQIMILRLLQQYGHKPIVIVGGATSMIGDPSGKNDTRKSLTIDDIEKNKLGIKKSLSKFIKFGDDKTDAIMLDNKDWLNKLNYIEFLAEFGKDFSVNRMLSMDSVKSRLERESNLTFLEFNYMLLQAYDFLYLYQNHNCKVQLGGSDQWGNIVMGTEIIRKKLGKSALGLTTPLLTTSSGAKMGKSASGAVWLNEEMLSPYDYFQYWRNIEDSDVKRFSKLYSEFNDNEEREFEDLIDKNINEAKKILALRLTQICHGHEAAHEAVLTAKKVFESGGIGESLPEITIPSIDLTSGILLSELLVMAKMVLSKSEAKKVIRGGGARVNNIKLEDENQRINKEHLTEEGYIKLSLGKKKHIVIRIV